MIRILFIHSKDERKAYKVHEYRDEDFGYLVEGEPGRGVEGPPFRDEDSARVIHEAAHAEFVDHDWFSIVSGGQEILCHSSERRYPVCPDTCCEQQKENLYLL